MYHVSWILKLLLALDLLNFHLIFSYGFMLPIKYLYI